MDGLGEDDALEVFGDYFRNEDKSGKWRKRLTAESDPRFYDVELSTLRRGFDEVQLGVGALVGQGVGGPEPAAGD